jgi:PAS domain S-box-containing protein
MIWFSDVQNRLTFVNNEFLRFTGQSYEELLGDRWRDPIHPDDVPHIEALYAAYLERPAAYQVEFRMRRADGEYRHMVSSMGPRFAGETYLGWAGSTIDITDLKHRQHEDLARQKLESVGTLAGGIAHDFNNLLGAVLAQAELAQAELADGSSPEAELNSIREIAMRGSKIVRELMIYAGKESQSLELVDVSEAVEEMLALLKISVSKHVTFRTELLQDLPKVRAASAQISQLIMNLVTNSSEALGDRDGVIGITTRRVMIGYASPGEPQGLAHGEYVQVAVSDTGCGVPPEIRTSIFDPFFSTKGGGRGFGLAMVHRIVEGLGGAINLASEPGQGTTFEILLPKAESPSDATCEPVAEDGQRTRQPKAIAVLIVEDEDALRQAVSMVLGKRGFHVIEAPDGSVALNVLRLRATPLDVLFLDITIPGASAREVLLEARRIRPELQVIVTSAYPEEMAGSFLESTIEHFMRKPYEIDDLVRLIHTRR